MLLYGMVEAGVLVSDVRRVSVALWHDRGGVLVSEGCMRS